MFGGVASSDFRRRVKAATVAPWFQSAVIVLILANAAILGLETYPQVVSNVGDLLSVINGAIIVLFAIEVLLRIYAEGWRFFRSGWNIFDLAVVAAAFIPATSSSAILRTLRLLRVFRLLSAVRSMRLVVATLGAAMPGVFAIGALLLMFLYVFAVASTELFSSRAPEHFGDLWVTFISLYRVLMGDGWDDIIVPLADGNTWVWGYFVAFTLVGAVVLLNLFIGIIVEGIDRMKAEDLAEDVIADIELDRRILREVQELRSQISRLQGMHYPPAAGGDDDQSARRSG